MRKRAQNSVQDSLNESSVRPNGTPVMPILRSRKKKLEFLKLFSRIVGVSLGRVETKINNERPWKTKEKRELVKEIEAPWATLGPHWSPLGALGPPRGVGEPWVPPRGDPGLTKGPQWGPGLPKVPQSLSQALSFPFFSIVFHCFSSLFYRFLSIFSILSYKRNGKKTIPALQ